MSSVDITLLTAPRYLSTNESDPYTCTMIVEDRYLMDALISEGFKVRRVAWDNPDYNWQNTKYALFRAVWDYFDRIDEFQEWYTKTALETTFINSKALIDWNIDKHYLQDLSAKGIHVPKTVFVEPGDKLSLPENFQKLKSQGVDADDFVIKPCIAAGARHTYKIHRSKAAQYDPIFQRLIAKEAMMVQEFQYNVVKEGEISLMLFNGEFTHAVLKVAKPGDFRVQDDYGGSIQHYNASEHEIAFAKQVVDAAPERTDYARIDIFKDNNGDLALAELEIFEPELWFRLKPDAAEVMAKQLKKRYFP